jgi:hypothetical protein
MIASLRGLAVLAGIAVLLFVAVLVAGGHTTAPVDHSIAPRFRAEQVTSILWGRGDLKGPGFTRKGDRWVDDHGIPANPAAIDAIFTAFRGGRWHRTRVAAPRDDREAHEDRWITVGDTTFSLGERLAGTGQVWLRRGQEELLVDGWVASALFPGPLDLQIRTPLDCAAAKSITADIADGHARIEGARLLEPRVLWLDSRVLDWLYDACSRIEIVSLEDGKRTQRGLHIALAGGAPAELTEVGTCTQGRVLVDTSVGSGCVDADRLRSLHDATEEAIRTAHGPIDLRPLPIKPVKLTLQDGSVLTLTGTPRLGDSDADPDRVRELVAALTARGEAAIERPATKPTGRIVAVDPAGIEVTLELLGDRLMARAGEAGAIRVRPADWEVITRPSAALRDATRWREEPTTIAAVSVDGVVYKRGAVLGEWTREPAGAVDTALVEALVETLATVKAPAGPPPASIAHRVKLTIAPPAGAPVTLTLELGAPTQTGCPGRVDGAAALLPLPLCTAALALASSR